MAGSFARLANFGLCCSKGSGRSLKAEFSGPLRSCGSCVLWATLWQQALGCVISAYLGVTLYDELHSDLELHGTISAAIFD